ncbi:hypothetical protein K439DRAFT_1614736 [Ramaria rubella]|nr:hypothetical protein K439DRAFT_1614736 [Ramaria rubella]
MIHIYTNLISVAFLVYDHILTFDDEHSHTPPNCSTQVQRIWKCQWSAVTIVWLLVRYSTLASLIVEAFVSIYPSWTLTVSIAKILRGLFSFNAQAILRVAMLNLGQISMFLTSFRDKKQFLKHQHVVLSCVVQVIMSIRTYGLYGRRTDILICLMFLLGIEFLAMGSSVYFLRAASGLGKKLLITTIQCLVRPSYPKNLRLASRAELIDILAIYWAGPLIEDIAIFLLTVHKSRQYVQQTVDSSLNLFTVFTRDGTLYFTVVCILHIINFFLFLTLIACLSASIGSMERICSRHRPGLNEHSNMSNSSKSAQTFLQGKCKTSYDKQ